ncbi:hypothetical protein M1N23_04255, partial [Dehalococcoidia bacterium]|nr:hypothetical protein [Dehalococcoidia bacterium]
ALPLIMGGAFDILSKAIALRPQVNIPTKPRMADFAAWGYAIAEAAGWGGSRFLAAYERNINQQHLEAISASVVAQAVIAFMGQHAEWQGPASELKPELDDVAARQGVDPKDRRSGWPQDPSRLSKELRRLAETLSANEVSVSFPHQGKRRSILLQTILKSGVGGVGGVGDAGPGRQRDHDNHPAGQPGADTADGTDGKKPTVSDDVMRISG